MEVTIDIEQVKRDFVSNARQMAMTLNTSAAVDFENAAKNRAVYWLQVHTPKPVAAFCVEPVFSFEPNWRFEFAVTTKLVSELDPDSLLPPPPKTDIGAVGGPVGAIIIDADDPVADKYSCSSSDFSTPGTLYIDPKTKDKFVKIAEGFAGLRKYWLKIK